MSEELVALEIFYSSVVFYYGVYLDGRLRRRNLESADKYYNLLKQALKRLEKFDKWVEKLKEDYSYAIQCWKQKLELNELYDPQPFKTLDEWHYWSDEK